MRTALGDRAPDADRSVLKIHVGPLEGQQLTLSHTRMDGQDIEGFEPIPTRRIEQTSRLFGGERPHLLIRRPRSLDWLADIARDHVPLNGLIEGLVQGHVPLVHGGWSEPGGQPILIEIRNVSGGELLQLEPAESGLDVDPHGYLVTVVGALPHGAAHGARKPGVQVLLDCHVLVVEDEPLVPVRHRSGQLLRHFRPRLAVDSLLLRAVRCVDRVAAHPPAVFALADASFVIAAPFRHAQSFPGFAGSIIPRSLFVLASNLSAWSSRPMYRRCSASDAHAFKAASAVSCSPRWTRTSCLTLPSSR